MRPASKPTLVPLCAYFGATLFDDINRKSLIIKHKVIARLYYKTQTRTHNAHRPQCKAHTVPTRHKSTYLLTEERLKPLERRIGPSLRKVRDRWLQVEQKEDTEDKVSQFLVSRRC